MAGGAGIAGVSDQLAGGSMSKRQYRIDRVRRHIVGGVGGAIAGGLALPSWARSGWSPRIVQPSPLFTLGVASGDPTARKVNLWTRLAPDPLNGGGMGSEPVEVTFEVASDPQFVDVVSAGVTTAIQDTGHTVNITVEDLLPDTHYWYRFSAMGETSRTGRTRTFPSFLSSPDRMRFALCSCQDYQAGFYAAYRDMAEQDLDFVIHTGDYIYEYEGDPGVPVERRHTGGETVTVEDYRNRYAQYRLDPNLQDAHAAFPWIVTWDDHEVDNNYARNTPEDDQEPAEFRTRRGAAYQVYLETMPLGPRRRLLGEANLNLFRRFSFGDLARFQVLDTRQFRDDQPCGDVFPAVSDLCPELTDPNATMTGELQERWLYNGLSRSSTIWNVIAQQVMFMQWDVGGVLGIEGAFNPDAWDGYQGARQRILDFLAANQISNPVVLTGDIHSSWASDIKADFNDPASAVVGAEFVCSGVTSVFGDENIPLAEATLPFNPHIKYFDGLFRGYVRCEVTREQWRADFRGVERVADPVFTVPDPDLPVNTIASYGVLADQPGVIEL
jgi:alkaline phosphatase D